MIHFNADGSIREAFLIRVLKGEAKEEDLDDEIAAWHRSDPAHQHPETPNPYETPDPLNQWLGLTEAEYERLVESAEAFKAIVAERRRANDARRRTVHDTPINPEMGEGRYQDTLRRFRARIAEGLSLDLDDSDFTGDKYTSASWGLCSCSDVKAYPDVNDHTFPDRIVDDMKEGHRILMSPRDPPEGATCPMDRGLQKPDKHNPGHSGCFYRCRLFKPAKGARVPTKEEALKLYDDLITAREQQFGRKVLADDREELWQPSGTLQGKSHHE